MLKIDVILKLAFRRRAIFGRAEAEEVVFRPDPHSHYSGASGIVPFRTAVGATSGEEIK